MHLAAPIRPARSHISFRHPTPSRSARLIADGVIGDFRRRT
jgi:kynureninase